jgi:hypothetical protein
MARRAGTGGALAGGAYGFGGALAGGAYGFGGAAGRSSELI